MMRALAGLASLLAMVAGGAEARTGEKARIGAFSIDRTEVTIGQFRAYAAATGLVTEAERAGGGFEWGAGWERRPGWTVYRPHGGEPDSPDQPAVHLTWTEAGGYCRWAGGRLPSAAEWLSAAFTEARPTPPQPFVRGRSYPYPTGESAEGANADGRDPWPRSAPAGRTKPGVNGLFDMGGNVWEWVADGQGGPAGEKRTMGGSWWYGADQMRREVAATKPGDFYAVYVGFRCAYDQPR